MKIVKKNRVFKPSASAPPIKDCAKISLLKNEQVTFLSFGSEYDFCKKSWGFYASPSINDRLNIQGFKCYLIENKSNKKYFVVVNNSKNKIFKKFLKNTNHKILEKL